jgi:hypothetical protein
MTYIYPLISVIRLYHKHSISYKLKGNTPDYESGCNQVTLYSITVVKN